LEEAGAYVASAVNTFYVKDLDFDCEIQMVVDFTTRRSKVTDYAVVMVAIRAGRTETIRVYDSAHGHNEMHRYSSAKGKQSGIRFHSGTLGEGMRAAIDKIEHGHQLMIEGWDRQ
jgi:hypothetical protein